MTRRITRDNNPAREGGVMNIESKYEDALRAIRFGIASLEAVKKGMKVDLGYSQRKMREVLFNESSEIYKPIIWEAYDIYEDKKEEQKNG